MRDRIYAFCAHAVGGQDALIVNLSAPGAQVGILFADDASLIQAVREREGKPNAEVIIFREAAWNPPSLLSTQAAAIAPYMPEIRTGMKKVLEKRGYSGQTLEQMVYDFPFLSNSVTGLVVFLVYVRPMPIKQTIVTRLQSVYKSWKMIALIIAVILLGVAGVFLLGGKSGNSEGPNIPKDRGVIVGPFDSQIWGLLPQNRITLCQVVGNTRPFIPFNCTLRADLTTSVDVQSNFRLWNVPPGWYVLFYETGYGNYDSILQQLDGQSIPVGDPQFAEQFQRGPDGDFLVPLYSFCANNLMQGVEYSECTAYALYTFSTGYSSLGLAHETPSSYDGFHLGVRVVAVEARPGMVTHPGFGEMMPVTEDSDQDGWPTGLDNCPAVSNKNQKDSDGDGYGDVCDSCPKAGQVNGILGSPGCEDRDQDSILDTSDNCLAVANSDQRDSDNNDIGDACQDTDQDEVVDSQDNCVKVANSDQKDVDNNGIGDACQDSDQDNVLDGADLCPQEAGMTSAAGCPDEDADGIGDKFDECPAEKGVETAKGCPDEDKDGVGDSFDECPSEVGVESGKGCPDADGDTILDADDTCPSVPGSKSGKGCPDADGDTILDADDLCPSEVGVASGKGCPDSDGDTIADADDLCPSEVGVVSGKGCPDKDGDAIADADDLCPSEVGVVSGKGCPDKDGDTVVDVDDICPDIANPDQGDINNDGIGDACQDSDGDGLLDAQDLCPTTSGMLRLTGCGLAPITADNARDLQLLVDWLPLESPDFMGDSFLLLGDDGTGYLSVWDIDSQAVYASYPIWSSVGYKISPDGTRLALGGQLWAITTPAPEQPLLTFESSSFTDFVFSPDGALLATLKDNSGIDLWDAHTGKLLETVEFDQVESTPIAINAQTNLPEISIQRILFSSNGTLLAVFGYSDSIRINAGLLVYIPRSGDPHTYGPLSDQNETAYNRSPDGRTLAVRVGYPASYLLIDLDTGMELSRIDLSSYQGWEMSAFGPNGSLFAIASKETRIWDVKTGNVVAELETSPNEEPLPGDECVGFSPDNQQVVTGSEGLSVWEIESGEKVQTLSNSVGWRNCYYTPNDRRIVGLDMGGERLNVWNAATGTVLMRTREVPAYIENGWGLLEVVKTAFYDPSSSEGLGIFGPDAKLIVQRVGDEIILLDSETGDVLKQIDMTSVNALSPQGDVKGFNSNGTLLLIQAGEGHWELWGVVDILGY